MSDLTPRHRLTPLDVGDRVSVRHRLADGAVTDVVGDLVAVTPDSLVVADRSRDPVVVAQAAVVAARVVGPSPRGAVELHAVSARAWAATETANLGEWLLSATPELAAARVNAARPLGDPGTDLDAALAAVSDWYTQRRMRPRLLVVTGSRLDRELERRGWRPRYDCLICVATVARLRHKLEGVHAEPAIAIERTASPQWWALFRGGNQPDAARPVVEGGPDVALATVIGPGDEAARAVGRACVDPPWIGLSSIAVAPEHRRRGYARSVIGALVEYGAQRGGVRVYLEVLADNTAALALYESLGFTRHHGYRYREWPDEPAQPSSER